MRGRTRADYWGVVLEARDANDLARFYVRLLDWTLVADKPGWATVAPPTGVAYLGFQSSPDYVPPVWPAVDGSQQMMMHLDVEVDDLEEAVADAVALGATTAEHQPQQNVRVMLDPAGHPFCLYLGQ